MNKESFKGVDAFFHPLRLKLITDYFSSKENKINSSIMSNLFQASAYHILSHEYGHTLSYFFLTQPKTISLNNDYLKYLKLRSCVSSFHIKDSFLEKKHLSILLIKHEGDRLRTEEDLADWFSYTLFSLNKPMECTFFSGVDELSSDIFYKQSSQENSYSITDEHSSHIFRLIFESNVKNLFSKECLSVFEQDERYLKIKTCKLE